MATTLGRATAAMSETSMPYRVLEREVLATVVSTLSEEAVSLEEVPLASCGRRQLRRGRR